jgi:D-gamma-glutamyl-meso-diaminopimelic acid endopeptidase CwlS
MDRREAARHWLVSTALAYLGTPYRWGGDDPSGFDCSGLVLECLASVGLADASDLSADGLYHQFEKYMVSDPGHGCLAFLLDANGHARHVGICLDRWHLISAGGGDREVVTPSEAWERNAYVRIRLTPPRGPCRRICDPLFVIETERAD